MRATVAAEIRLHAPIPQPLADAICEALTIDNPEYLTAEKQGRWTGDMESTIRGWRRHLKGGMVIPRGFGRQLRQLCTRHDEPLEVDWQMSRGTKPLVGRELAPMLTPRDYQAAAVDAMLQAKQGMVVAPTGAGKTVIGCLAVGRANVPALILTHTHELADQWRESFDRVFGLKTGIVGGGEDQRHPVTVAMVQTLHRWSDDDVAAFGAGFGMVLADEVQHLGAQSWYRLINLMPCLYRFGVTATPTREDGLTELLHWAIGPIVYRIEHASLEDAGHLMAPEVVPVKTGWTWPAWDEASDKLQQAEADGANEWKLRALKRKRDQLFAKLLNAIAEDDERNQILIELIADQVHDGRTVLVLSQRVAHCERLCAALEAIGVESGVLVGKTPKRARADILGRFRGGSLPVVLASSLADEGLDAPSIDCMVNAMPARHKGRTVQRIGRLMRPMEGKRRPVMFDLVDSLGVLRGQWASRKSAYKSIGAEIRPWYTS